MAKLHHRDDEEPEDDLPFISRECWLYKGCRFCGHEDHQERDCPHKPKKVD
jgi:hypothetical protein